MLGALACRAAGLADDAATQGGAMVGASAPVGFDPIPGVRELTGELIVKPLPMEDLLGAGLGDADAVALYALGQRVLAGYEVVGELEFVDEPASIVLVPPGQTEAQVAASMMATGAFEYVQPNWRVFALECPDDPLLGDQWHHDADHLGSCAGWEIEVGDPGVAVGICDTGVDIDHGDLDTNRVEGYNASTRLFESEGGKIRPTSSHGTRVAGCAAGQGNNGFGISGVGQSLSYRPIRVSENGSNSQQGILIHGALTSIAQGDRVANVSFSGVDSPAILDAATSIKQMGGLLVWSAGNDSRTLTFGDRDDDDLIVVGATRRSDNLANFSARGPFVDLVAPGQGVFTSSPNNNFTNVNGTSFSAPLAAGLAAMIFSTDPSMTPDEVEQILKLGTDDLGQAGIDDTFGYGRISTLEAMRIARPSVELSLIDPAPERVQPGGGTSFRVAAADGTDSLDPASGLLTFDDGSGAVSVPLTDLGGGQYQAEFPAFDCAAQVEYFLSFQSSGGQTVRLPQRAPDDTFDAIVATSSAAVLDDDFQSDLGWSSVAAVGLTSGQWQRGEPGDFRRGDPSSDADGSGQAYLTGLAGGEDVDGGSATLTSPAMDLSESDHAILRYSLWFFVGQAGQDTLRVEISPDGSEWVALETLDLRTEGWEQRSIAVEDFVPLTDRVQLRVVIEDAGDDTTVEGGLDGFSMTAISCGPGCPADLTGASGGDAPDGVVDASDFFEYLARFASGDPRADLTGSGGNGSPDGVIDAEDFFFYLASFAAGCP